MTVVVIPVGVVGVDGENEARFAFVHDAQEAVSLICEEAVIRCSVAARQTVGDFIQKPCLGGRSGDKGTGRCSGTSSKTIGGHK